MDFTEGVNLEVMLLSFVFCSCQFVCNLPKEARERTSAQSVRTVTLVSLTPQWCRPSRPPTRGAACGARGGRGADGETGGGAASPGSAAWPLAVSLR